MIKAQEYEQRREKLFEKLDDGSITILFAGVAKKKSGDADYDFCVNRNFYYLTGIEQDNSILMLVKADGETSTYLFIDEKDVKKEQWIGFKLTDDEAREISNIENVCLRSSFEGKLSVALSKGMTHFGEIKKIYLDLEKELKIDECKSTNEFKNELLAKYPSIQVEDVYDKIMKLRIIKSPAEIELIKDAIHTTDVALRNVLSKMEAGRFEYNLRNIFEFTVKEDLNATLAFPSIVAGGKNAVILHYPNAQDMIKEGDLVLLDVGACKSNYCADISRTYPISGKYSELQAKIYSIVLNCNKQTAKFIRPGILLKEVQQFALDFLAEECFAQGLIESKEDIRKVYYHSVSHHLGLDTHDGNDRDSKLEPGMVITCEPGLYFKDYGIGVRIEDDVLVTEDGSEVLSKDVMKEIDEIETILRDK